MRQELQAMWAQRRRWAGGQILIATELHYNIRNPEGGGDNEAEEEKGAEVRWGQIQSMVRPSEDCHSTSHNYADSHTSQRIQDGGLASAVRGPGNFSCIALGNLTRPTWNWCLSLSEPSANAATLSAVFTWQSVLPQQQRLEYYMSWEREHFVDGSHAGRRRFAIHTLTLLSFILK